MALVDLLNGGLIELKFEGFSNNAGDTEDPKLFEVGVGSKGLRFGPSTDLLNGGPLTGNRVTFSADSNANPTFQIGQDHRNPGMLDGLVLRGGVTTNVDRREIDVKRLTNFLASPTGNQFLIRQAALQLLNPQSNTRTFNAGASLLAQIAASGLSNFKRHGLIPEPADVNINTSIGNVFGDSFLGNLASDIVGSNYISTFTSDEKLTTNFNLGDPGADLPLKGLAKLAETVLGIKKSVNPKEYAAGNIKNNFIKLDKINLLDVVSTDDGNLPEDLEPFARDLVNFRFEVVNQDNLGATDYIIFRAFIDSYSDSFNAGHNTVKYNGRAEEFYTYDNFKRRIDVGFKIAAQSRHDMYPLYRKLNYLAAQTAPDYSSQGRIRTPYMKLTMGDYFNKLPGVLSSVSISWQKDYTWEIALDKFERDKKEETNLEILQENLDAKDKHMLVLPHVLDIQISYLPIHNFAPSNKFNNAFIGIDYWLNKRNTPAEDSSTALYHDKNVLEPEETTSGARNPRTLN